MGLILGRYSVCTWYDEEQQFWKGISRGRARHHFIWVNPHPWRAAPYDESCVSAFVQEGDGRSDVGPLQRLMSLVILAH